MTYEKVSYVMSNEEKEALKQDINALREKVSKFSINLSVNERHSMQKMGNKSIAFVEQSLKYAKEHPEFVPPYLNLEEFEKDLDLANQLRDLLKIAEPVLEKLSDTFLAAGADAFAAARAFYDSIKAAAKNNAPGADAIVAELKKRYDRRKSKTRDEETATN
ncbi:MAG: hypothetical protein JSV88_16785 [Candidatus Aminicenantes bacterium]|nr:MAG: hypothetical protein JSV88_16785 [Candidatus Aminicenantes bacterium]